ncbi:CYTH domain-containing protein [Microbacterium halophytorum]|uniref:CYTH domain-containing protein n=1 Tax=Microbacterium halophytorum TaxID=2067568 RepID=UPI000CFA9EF1|nr:CYTH domain-containing protein [Microbacterium halophytorum]
MAATPQAEPSRSVEIEKKFDVDEGTPLPNWGGIPGVASVSPGEARHLDAMYLDTTDAALARAGVAVRRRTGGPDAGWHIKGPLVDGGRTELGWPLGEGDRAPDALLAEIAPWATEPLEPLARIVNDRTAYELRDEEGHVVAEFVDDRVRATDLRSGVDRAWAEWEIELGPAGPQEPAARDAFFAAVAAAAEEAGARPAASASKLARALGR